MGPRGVAVLGAVATLSGVSWACAAPDGARPDGARRAGTDAAPATYPVVWDISLGVASLADVPRRLASVPPDRAEEAAFDTRCTRAGADTSDAVCRDIDTLVTTTCAAFLARHREGYSAAAYFNFKALRSLGAWCSAIEALGTARPARQSAVRAFRLTRAAPESLPPVLGLNPSQQMTDSALRSAARGVPWAQFDPSIRADTSADPYLAGALVAQSEGEETRLRILARGDFDEDGWDDILLQVVGVAKGGSMVAPNVYVLSRRRPGVPLAVTRTVW